MEKVVMWEDSARCGEINLHMQALDPGPGGFTLACCVEEGEEWSKIFHYSFRKYQHKAGIKKRMVWQQCRTNETLGPDGLTIQQIVNCIPLRSVTNLASIRNHNTYILTHLGTLVTFYSQFRADRFLNYRGKQIALERMAK